MNEIWANRLIAGTKTWAEVPASRKGAVKAVLGNRVLGNYRGGIHCMISAELIDRLTALVKEQADIIEQQAGVIAQFENIPDLRDKIKALSQKRAEICDE